MQRLTAAGYLLGLVFGLQLSPASAEKADHVSQYGITWTFDKPAPVGQFVNGDWWVVGPVTVVSVTPAPGPAAAEEVSTQSKSIYGANSLRDDKSMRNGSMIVTDVHLLPPDRAKTEVNPGSGQGYDSRPTNYDPRLSISFPLKLESSRSLISTISAEATAPAKDGSLQLATPFLIGQSKFPLCTATLPLALETAAILTCLDKEPPADAFRPPYAGAAKPIYEAKNLRWDLLPKLKAVPSTPAWDKMERIFQRPWLDHSSNWLMQFTAPGLNQPNYGREFARMSSIAGLMLLLDVPDEQKKKLLIEYVQLGIDLSGLAHAGRQWFSDGGHWQGRKWPILFASIMLNDPEIRNFPTLPAGEPIYGPIVADLPGPRPTTIFQEDVDTYYGAGGEGQKVLWQVGSHTGPRSPHEEKPRTEFSKDDSFVESYRMNNAASWIGVALAARWMKAQGIWNHDAFFDYLDRWMSPEEKFDRPAWLAKESTRSFDPFVEEMWFAYRPAAPVQESGKDNMKWVWADDPVDRFKTRNGGFVPNPKTGP